MDRPRLLFICPERHTFVEDDLALLQEHYDVQAFVFDADRAATKLGHLVLLFYYGLTQLLWLLKELPRADGVYGWFVDYHMVLPVGMARLLGKPTAVVLGGFECNYLPELNYGIFGSRWRAPLARYVFRNASLLLPVAGALIYSETRFATWPARRANGVYAHLPGLHTPYRVVPTGYDPEAWPCGPGERPPVVCTVAHLDSERRILVKGVDLLFQAAARLPEVTFQVVGVPTAYVPHVQRAYHPPRNVQLLPPRSREALQQVYTGASVYAQLSRTEGLPNVLCEAMLCGCVPVVSNVGGMPEGVGRLGIQVEAPDPEQIAQALRQALSAGPEVRRQVRQHVAEHFSKARRRAQLTAVLDSLWHPASE